MTTVQRFYGLDVQESSGSAAATTADVLEVFEFLKPKASTTPLIRIGGDQDGSYLIPDDLEGIAACFSPGVNRIKYFEDYLTDHYGIQAHMCDFSCDVDQLKTPLRPGMQTFVKKWLDVDPGRDNINLEDWIRDHDVSGDLLLQMDIEGAEYRNLLATSNETLGRFRIIVLEVHRLGHLLEAGTLREVIAPFFAKLARGFTSVHAHPNNCCGDVLVPGTDIRIPNALELTLVRNDHFASAAGPAALPHPLDVSRNVPRKAPLFLSEAWCDYSRPLESRVKILEDTLDYRDDNAFSGVDSELGDALSLTMQSLQTLRELTAPASSGGLVEVAGGRRYELSSAYGGSSRTGVVEPTSGYFFHTGFGKGQSIRVDLGRQHRIRRIEITNRENGLQERARHLFVLLDGSDDDGRATFPMYADGPLPGGVWQECGVDLPDVPARYVTITSPMSTALHFADLRVYAAGADRSSPPIWRRAARRGMRSVRSRLGRLTAATRRAQPPAARG